MVHRILPVFTPLRLLLSMLPFRGLSVCLPITFIHCAQMAEDIDTSTRLLVHRLRMIRRHHVTSLPEIALKSGLHRSTASLTNFAKKWINHFDLRDGHYSMTNCGRMVTDSATVTMESLYRKPSSLFRMVPSMTPYDLPFHPKGHDACCHL